MKIETFAFLRVVVVVVVSPCNLIRTKQFSSFLSNQDEHNKISVYSKKKEWKLYVSYSSCVCWFERARTQFKQCKKLNLKSIYIQEKILHVFNYSFFLLLCSNQTIFPFVKMNKKIQFSTPLSSLLLLDILFTFHSFARI